jgi:hypothetical protein
MVLPFNFLTAIESGGDVRKSEHVRVAIAWASCDVKVLGLS